MASALAQGRPFYLRELLLVVVGALIALSSSLLTTMIQGDAQRAQMLLDKKIELLRDYSGHSNGVFAENLQKLQTLQHMVFTMEKSLSAGEFPPPEDSERFNAEMEATNKSINAAATLFGNRALLLALFGREIPERKVDYSDKRYLGEALEWQQRAQAMLKTSDQAKSLAPLYRRLGKTLDKAERTIVDEWNGDNAMVVALANQLRQGR